MPVFLADALRSADAIEVLSLDPSKPADRSGFHGWPVLGTTPDPGPEARRTIAESVIRGGTEGEASGALCFDPRHGLRVTAGGRTIEVVLCFECSWVYVYCDEGEFRYVTTPFPSATLNRVLTEHGVPLAR